MNAPWLVWDHPEPLPTYQGIRYLALTLLPAPQAPTSATLVIHLLATWSPPFAFKASSLTIIDGEGRPVPFTVASQVPLNKVLTLDLTPLPDQFHSHSDVTVTLLEGGGPLDAFFARSTFVFTIDCERGDCRPLVEKPPRRLADRPAIDLLTKDYAGFVALLFEWARVKNPAMADLAPASLERLVLELLAHQGDMLSYFQDRVANEAFVETASQRHALREHATLLGAHLFDGAAAETWLAFRASSDGYVPAGVEVYPIPGPENAEVVFHLVERTRVLAAHSMLTIAAWPGAAQAIVPAGATEILLWGRVENLRPGQPIALVQGTATGVVPFSQVVSITRVTHLSLPGWVASPADMPALGDVEVTLVAFDPELQAPIAPWDSARPLSLHANVGKARFGSERTWQVSAIEGELAADPHNHVIETRTDAAGKVTRYLRATRLPEGPVVHDASPDLPGKPRSAPAVRVTIDKERWERREHLHGSRSYDRHYVATADEDGSLWLQLGDGKNGMAVPIQKTLPAASIQVDYRVGDPVAGNIGVGALVRFVPDDLTKITDFFDLTVVNVTPGTFGLRPESKGAARLRLPATIRNGPLERAVTLPDYASAARTVPGVARAAAKAITTPFSTVLVLVDPEGSAGLDPDLQTAVHERVDLYRMAGREHVVRPPVYVPIEVDLAICAEPGTLRHRVRDAVLAALRPGTDSAPGFFHPDKLTFGDDLALGDLLAFVQAIAGVRAVKALVFKKMFVPGQGDVAHRIVLGPTEVLRLDADEDRPENGKLTVRVVGLDPSLDESDFEVKVTP